MFIISVDHAPSGLIEALNEFDFDGARDVVLEECTGYIRTQYYRLVNSIEKRYQLYYARLIEELGKDPATDAPPVRLLVSKDPYQQPEPWDVPLSDVA